MKKVLLIVLVLIAALSAQIRMQGEAGLIGTGYGLGMDTNIVPMIFDLGVEGAILGSPQIKSTGTYEGIDYEGAAVIHVTRFGGYAKLTLPIADQLPVIGMFLRPIFHFGTQNGVINIDGTIRPLNNGAIISGTEKVQGSYFLVGFPTYLGPLYVEPAFGSQHIYIPGYANYKNSIDARIAAGLAF